MPNRFFAICTLVFMLGGFGRHASLRRHEIAPSPATGNELRLDGYWYTIEKSKIRPDLFVTRYFFFKNGKVLFGFNCSPYELNYRESDFTDEFFKQQLTARYNANLTNFAVDGGRIEFERISPVQDYPHGIFQGIILNDSTFVIKIERNCGNIETVNEKYHFKAFPIPEKYQSPPIEMP